MRHYLIAGNWKMHGSKASVKVLIEKLLPATSNFTNIDILVLPSLIHIPEVVQLLSDSKIKAGAQNCYYEEQGAFTGEVSASMLKDSGCSFVLAGHSERRQLFHESDELVARKFKAVIEADLIPILCVGETLEQREQHLTELIIAKQINTVIEFAGISAFKQAVIAYEPVWAIGTGLTATPEQAQAVHDFIRKLIAENNVDIASTIRILYGGSMKPENAGALLAMPDVDGGLIGGASLNAESFAKICEAAGNLTASSTQKAVSS